MGMDLSAALSGGFGWFDGVAAGILLLFAWRGYRRGLLGWLAGLGATLLSLALAAVLAPVVASLVAAETGWGRVIEERVVFVVLLIVLRLVVGWALRELVASLRPMLRALPPLALVDHLLGVVPSLLLGTVLVLVVLMVALLLPVNRRLHEAASRSYIGRVASIEVRQATRLLPQTDLIAHPGKVLQFGREITDLAPAAGR